MNTSAWMIVVGSWTCSASALAEVSQPEASVTLAGQTEIARLVDLASQRLGVRVEYDPDLLKGSVTVRGAGDSGIPDSELWDAVNSALASRGFTVIRASGQGAADAQRAFTVVRLTDAANLVMPEGPFDGNKLIWSGLEPGYASVFLKVQHRQPKVVAELLKTVMSKSGSAVTAVGDSDLLLVSDLVPRLKLAADFLARIDTPQAPTELVEVPLVNATPSDIIAFVRDMGRQPGGPASPAANQRPPGDVLPQPGANAVLVLSPKEHLAFWKDLIAKLDTRQAMETRNYTPKNADAKSLVNLVEQVAGIGSGPKPEGPSAQVIADEFTGTLIVTATASQHARISELLSRIDAASGSAPTLACPVERRNAVRVTLPFVAAERGATEQTVHSLAVAGPEPKQRAQRQIRSGFIAAVFRGVAFVIQAREFRPVARTAGAVQEPGVVGVRPAGRRRRRRGGPRGPLGFGREDLPAERLELGLPVVDGDGRPLNVPPRDGEEPAVVVHLDRLGAGDGADLGPRSFRLDAPDEDLDAAPAGRDLGIAPKPGDDGERAVGDDAVLADAIVQVDAAEAPALGEDEPHALISTPLESSDGGFKAVPRGLVDRRCPQPGDGVVGHLGRLALPVLEAPADPAVMLAELRWHARKVNRWWLNRHE